MKSARERAIEILKEISPHSQPEWCIDIIVKGIRDDRKDSAAIVTGHQELKDCPVGPCRHDSRYDCLMNAAGKMLERD